MINKHFLYVYGSLKQGMGRHQFLKGQRYIGTAITTSDYAMFQLSGYPAMINKNHPEAEVLLEKGGNEIYGEIYEVDHTCINELDKIEGCDTGLYERKFVDLKEIFPIQLPSCQEVFGAFNQKRAEAYFYKKQIGGARNCGIFWSHK